MQAPTTTEPTLEILVDACRDGKEDAVRQLYEATSAQLFGVAFRIVRRRDIAEDVLHEAYVQIWQNAARFDRNKGSAWTWIASIVRYRSLDALDKLKRETPAGDADDEATVNSPPAPDLADAHRFEAHDLRRCLSRLETQPRACILLAYVDGYSQTEIATRVDAPLGTVKSWIRRGLIALKRCLER